MPLKPGCALCRPASPLRFPAKGGNKAAVPPTGLSPISTEWRKCMENANAMRGGGGGVERCSASAVAQSHLLGTALPRAHGNAWGWQHEVAISCLFRCFFFLFFFSSGIIGISWVPKSSASVNHNGTCWRSSSCTVRCAVGLGSWVYDTGFAERWCCPISGDPGSGWSVSLWVSLLSARGWTTWPLGSLPTQTIL